MGLDRPGMILWNIMNGLPQGKIEQMSLSMSFFSLKYQDKIVFYLRKYQDLSMWSAGWFASQFKTQNPDPKKWHEVTSNETGSVQSPKTDKQSQVRSLDNLWIPSLSEHWRCETRWESTGSTFWKRRWNTEKIMQTSSIMCCTLWLFNVAMKNKHLNLGTVVLCKSECLLSISMSHGFHSCHSYVEYPDGTVYPDS